MKLINMKNYTLYLGFLFATMLFACKKEDKRPVIVFKTGVGYTAVDKIVAKNSIVLVGIEAEKTGSNHVLTTFDAARVYDDDAPESFLTESLTGADGDRYSRDISITTRNFYGTEKYVFTVTDSDGQTQSVSFTLAVQ